MSDLRRLSKRETAALLKCHIRTISNYLKEETPIPINTDRRSFDGPAVVRWFTARTLERSKRPAVETEAAQKYLERYRKERWKLSRLERRQREASLMPLDEIEQEWNARVQVVTAGLESFVDRLSPLLANRPRDEIRRIIKAEVRQLRDSYSREGKYTPKIETTTEVPPV